MRAIWPGAPNMRKPLVPKHRNEAQLRPRGIASTVLCASLTAGVMFLSPGPAIAQSIPSNMPPAVGMGATSPLSAGSARAGRHSARFDRDRNARHQSGRSFAERGNDDLRRLRRRRTFRRLCSTAADCREAPRSPAPTAGLFRRPFPRLRRSDASEFHWAQPNSAVPASVRQRLRPVQICRTAPSPTTSPGNP